MVDRAKQCAPRVVTLALFHVRQRKYISGVTWAFATNALGRKAVGRAAGRRIEAFDRLHLRDRLDEQQR